MKLLIDFDGVYTDGKMFIDYTGEKPFKQLYARDIRATRELIANAWEVVIVSADDWAGNKAFVEKLGAEFLAIRDKREIPYTNFVGVGDDAWDVPMLKMASRAFCPADADQSVLDLPGITILKTKGGHGVIAELVRILLNEEKIE